MRVDILTNVQPIVAGDDIAIAIRPAWYEIPTAFWYRIEAIADSTTTTIADAVSPFNLEYDWIVDIVGQVVVFKVTALPIVHSAFSDPVTITPSIPVLTAPTDNELLHAGSPYAFRWTQTPPAPSSYRLRFSTDGAQTFPELGGDFAGNVTEITRAVPATPTQQGRVRLEGIWPLFDPLFNPPIEVRTTDQTLLHVVHPTSGAVWHIDSNDSVSWSAAGDIDHFKVELSRDGGSSWTTLAANVAGSVRHLDVSVDAPISSHCHVRVEAFGPTGSVTAQGGTFHIAGARPVHHPRD
jgi:hypothetical protein